jgi:hypothetical protein
MSEQGTQNSEDISILFAAGRNDPLQAGVNFRPLFGAEATAHVLLDFCRAQVAFGRFQLLSDRRFQWLGQWIALFQRRLFVPIQSANNWPLQHNAYFQRLFSQMGSLSKFW